jgi:hypothetical protein
VHRNNILIYIQQDATLHSLFYLETTLHVSGGTITHHQERKQLYLQHLLFVTPFLLSAAIVEELELVSSRPLELVIAICRYRGRVTAGWSVLWVAYATHSTRKAVPSLPR